VPEMRTMPTPPTPGGVAIAAMVSVATETTMEECDYFPPRSTRRVITHCWAMERVLFTTQ